jgi:hypothetical protein
MCMFCLLVEGRQCSFYEASVQKLKTHTLINRESSLLDMCGHLLPLIALLSCGDNYSEGPRPPLGPELLRLPSFPHLTWNQPISYQETPTCVSVHTNNFALYHWDNTHEYRVGGCHPIDVKSVHVLNWLSTTLWRRTGCGCVDPHINLGTSWKWVVSFTPRGKIPRYPLDRRLAGPQDQSERRGEKKNLVPTGSWTATPRSSRTRPIVLMSALFRLIPLTNLLFIYIVTCISYL